MVNHSRAQVAPNSSWLEPWLSELSALSAPVWALFGLSPGVSRPPTAELQHAAAFGRALDFSTIFYDFSTIFYDFLRAAHTHTQEPAGH